MQEKKPTPGEQEYASPPEIRMHRLKHCRTPGGKHQCIEPGKKDDPAHKQQYQAGVMPENRPPLR